MGRTLIYSTDALHEKTRRLLSEYGLSEATADPPTLGGCEILVAWPRRVKRELLAPMARLRMIQTLSAGVDGMDFGAIAPGVKVYSNAGAYTEQVAEAAWGLILGVAKGLNVRNKQVVPRILRGKTLLVLGCGAIGSEVARFGRAAFAMKTVGVSRSFRHPEYFDLMYSPDETASALTSADVIVDALPLTNETRSFLGYDLLKLSRQNVIIANVGRGETIDLESMSRFLAEREDARFATDVFWKTGGRENFDVPLWNLPNFAGTLHTGGGVGNEEALEGAEISAAENVVRFIKTGAAENAVMLKDYV